MPCYPFKIRLYMLCNLIFFVLLFYSCSEKSSEIEILWRGDRATGIIIPETLTKNVLPEHSLTVHLIAADEPIAMLGSFRKQNGAIIFEPLVPLTRGLTY